MSHDQAAFHADRLRIEHDVEKIIEKAQHETISKDEAAMLMWAAGITTKINALTEETK